MSEATADDVIPHFRLNLTPLGLHRIQDKANEQERRKLLLMMLDAVYFEAKKTRSIVLIKPKPPFRPIFQVAVKKAGTDIRIINEPSRYKVENPPVFVVETGEIPSPPETSFNGFVAQSVRMLPFSLSPKLKSLVGVE